MSENKFQTPNKFRIILYSIFGGMLALSGELMPDDFKEKLQNFVWNNWHISFFWFWLGLIGLLTLLIVWLEIKKETTQTTPSVLGQDFEANRPKIILSFAKRYKNRYEQKLDERIALNLELKYTQIGTNSAFVDRYFTKDAKTEADIQKELIDVVLKHRYILIVGQPGAGKTTLLLETAMALLDKAKQDHTALPVIFNLSSWRTDYIDFNKWLADMLVEGNGFSKKLAEEALAKKQIIPLLDGLDELGRSLNEEKAREILRGQCLSAINQFLTQYNPEYMVICSRIEEYKTIADNAPVKAEILVKPLTIEQIENALKPRAENPNLENQRPHANVTAAQNILYLLKANPIIAETLTVPFYFHLATQVFDNQILSENFANEKKEFKAFLVKLFVEKKLKNSKNAMFLDLDKNRNWLCWLADKLNKHHQTRFELVFLQPILLSKLIFYKLHIVLFIFILYGCFLGELLELKGGWILAAFTLFGIIEKPKLIETYEKRKWSFSKLKSCNFWSIAFLFGSFSVWILSEFYGWVFNFFGEEDKGYLLGILLGITGILLQGIEEFSTIYNFSNINTPYKRLKSGIGFSFLGSFTLIFIFLFLWELFTSTFSTKNLIIYVTVQAVLIALFLSLIENPFINHFRLRFFLWLEGSIPLRLVHFLNYVTDGLRFLERDGGSWRFRHQILQDYFAGLAQKE